MIEVENDFRCGTGSWPPATVIQSKKHTTEVEVMPHDPLDKAVEYHITNIERTASGADELIVELMKRLTKLTDSKVITGCNIKIEYEDPKC